VVAEIARMARERRFVIPMHGRMADLALVTSAMLMAVSDQGVHGEGGMGLWGPAIFTIPLLGAWYSYEHLEIIRRTYDQTIRALGAAPELGGLVRSGHAERVAALAVAIASERGFSRQERCFTILGRCVSTSPRTAADRSRSRLPKRVQRFCAAHNCSPPLGTSSRLSGRPSARA
jgi:hypothetical protein